MKAKPAAKKPAAKKPAGRKRIVPISPAMTAATRAAELNFARFVYERQAVWLRRSRGTAAPWTTDVLLQDYVFCNVYRELDRGTVYFRSRADARSLRTLLFASVVYRLLNKIESFVSWKDAIPSPREWPQFKAHLVALRLRGRTIFTGAHQTSGLARYSTTVDFVRAHLARLAAALHGRLDSAEACYKVLGSIPHVGPFFAWQILCDLIEAGYVRDSENAFVALGPGAKLGIRRIYGADDLGLVETLRRRLPALFRALTLDFAAFRGRPLTLKNIEHCLCEFEKYENGMPRSRRFVSRAALDADVVCRVCADPSDHRDHLLLLCDLCNAAYHTTCLHSPLDAVPLGSWVCDGCAAHWAAASCRD